MQTSVGLLLISNEATYTFEKYICTVAYPLENHAVELELTYYFFRATVFADSGTEQLEFIALSQRTGDPKYQQKVTGKA
uniref:Uncharacterized protein n=1 Tax=Arundo donax TaxID=35708 RepID=A0A0A9D5Y9_ARUDO